MSAPIFADLGDTTINVAEIKWLRVKEPNRVHVEFVSGGWIIFEGTLGQFRTALDDAIKEAAPY